jgi:hypothetical protein
VRPVRCLLALAVAVGSVLAVPVASPGTAEAAVPPTFTDSLVAPMSYALDLAFLPDATVLVDTKSVLHRPRRRQHLRLPQ